ncbi:MFS transporter [Acidiferrimicrobium sp. IK]|uniref:MFS transporter n=1 Tax=Acidiferrimicrobium sp. IK TaxID=2871700 RepID=UPI0021CB1321|nr:MFS transporter [Acidiferrimicrobium sp. IK]MCU4185262.1 MFS transporter [Acidiferrimicrobium sp. IK]
MTPSPAPQVKASTAAVMLALATVGFTVNFWAWALLSPLGATYRKSFHLSSFEQAFLVAIPVLVGSLGRIPVGALTDRFGARIMFPLITALTIAPVVFIGSSGDSYVKVVAAGFFLGLAGTVFAIGIPMVNAWFGAAKRGLALGIFGIGMGGTAISALSTVKLADHHGRAFPFYLAAAALAAYAILSAVLLRDAPGRTPVTAGMWARTASAMRLRVTVQLSFLYSVGFGGFVAFSVYLPTLLKTSYGLSPGSASDRAAGFVLVAVVMRPVGGWLSDRFHPIPVLIASFAAVAALALVVATHLALVPGATACFLAMAAGLGAAAGACFALVAKVTPADKVGAVTGVVGAAGGLGGFLPPLVMGAVYGWTHSYAIGFVLLAAVAAAAALYTGQAMLQAGQDRAATVALPFAA